MNKKLSPSEHIESLVITLRARGARVTPARQLLLELLVHATEPLSAEKLQAALAKKKRVVSKTTVYRELEFLLGEGLVASIFMGDDTTRYEITSTEHHHHVICTSCRRVEDVETPGAEEALLPLERRLAKKINFAHITHALEFFGLCNSCARKA
jgi:Fe2+ or Zn2+ uptake regulation protein